MKDPKEPMPLSELIKYVIPGSSESSLRTAQMIRDKMKAEGREIPVLKKRRSSS